MAIRVAINGFGRIRPQTSCGPSRKSGRRDIEVVGHNNIITISARVETNAHLLRFRLRAWPVPRHRDRRWRTRSASATAKIKVFRRGAIRQKLPWKELGVDIRDGMQPAIFSAKAKANRPI